MLLRAKELIPHGGFTSWLRSVGLHPRSAQQYIQVAEADPAEFGNAVTLTGFLKVLQKSKRRKLEADPETEFPLPGAVTLANTDCRTYRWPSAPTAIADPPWHDRDGAAELYTWVGRWAAETLEPGGLLLAQTSTRDLPQRLNQLSAGGLGYVWSCSICYEFTRRPKVFGSNWQSGHRLILVFSKGKPRKTLPCVDTCVLKPYTLKFHPWEQPEAAYRHFFSFLTPPNSLVLDPFCGSGSATLAAARLGRRVVATEVDPATYRIARKRIAEADLSPSRSPAG